MPLKDKFLLLSPFDRFLLIVCYLLTIIPLVSCGFSWWVNILLYLLLSYFDVLGGILTIGLWIYSTIRVISGLYVLPWTIIHFVGLALYVAFFVVPNIINLFIGRRRDYYDY